MFTVTDKSRNSKEIPKINIFPYLRGSSEPISLGTFIPKAVGSDPLPTQK